MEKTPITRRKWHIIVELSNGQVSYNNIIPVDLVKYVKKERRKKSDNKHRKLTPVISWVIDAVFEDCRNILTLHHGEKKPEIVSIEITQSMKKKENYG